MNKIANIQIVLVLIISFVVCPAHAERIAVPLKDIIDGSQNIVVGKVIGFANIDEQIKGYDAALARIQILEVLKGNLKINNESNAS